MTEPVITPRRFTCSVPVTVVGTDDQGRPVVVCPHCFEEAPIDGSGKVLCSLGGQFEKLTQQAMHALGDMFRGDI